MTLGAFHRDAEPGRAGGIDPIDHLVGAVLLGVDAGLDIASHGAVESGGDFLGKGGLGQEVAGELLDGELIVGLVGVERVDDPVAIGP